MLSIYLKEPNMIGITVDGKIDADAMETGLDDYLELTRDMEDGTSFYRISNFEMPSLSALGVKLNKLPRLFKSLGKLKKCAVLTEHGWIAKASEIEGALMPGLSIKAFAPDEEDAALSWLKSA